MKPLLDLAAIFPELTMISDASIREGVESVWQELWQASGFESINDVPTSPEIPYPHVPHNRAVLSMALAAADAFERFHSVHVNRDVLVAAGLLQDASKLVEYVSKDGRIVHTEIGDGYPHAFWGAHVALRHGLPAAVCQIILSHTSTSPRFPSSVEGKILYYVDQLDIVAVFGDRWRKELFITK